jgi:two-component system sensor kinase
MEDLARSTFEDLIVQSPNSEIRFIVRPSPPARGDQAMMHQVLINILSNAIKFTKNNPQPVIEFGCLTDQDEKTYYVKDNGVGFDMRYSDKLFGVFQRLHSVEEFEGTGVGLAIVYRIATRHGGRVWAEGEVGKGATFYFTLP